MKYLLRISSYSNWFEEVPLLLQYYIVLCDVCEVKISKYLSNICLFISMVISFIGIFLEFSVFIGFVL